MFVVMCSDGTVTVEDITGQSDEQKVPVAITRPRNGSDAVPNLLVFGDEEVARKFALKNFPKTWLVSVVDIGHNLEWIKDRGWTVEQVAYAKLMNSHPDYELTYAVLDFQKRDGSIIRM